MLIDAFGVNSTKRSDAEKTLVLWGADDRIFDVSCAERYCAGSREYVAPDEA